MDYELCRKLKEKGFKQGDNQEQQMLKEEGDPFEPNNRTMWVKYFTPEYLEEMKDKVVYIPTLSELIDFVDGNDKMKEMENEYIKKALLKLQRGKES